MGRHKESVEAGQKAVALDPENHFARCNLSWAHYANADYKRAAEQLQITADSFGWDCPYHYHLKFRLLIQNTDDPELLQPAIEELSEKLRNGADEEKSALGLLATLYADAGRAKEAGTILDSIQSIQQNIFIDPIIFVGPYTKLGDYESALDYLEQAYMQRSFNLIYTINMNPLFEPLRDHPRFKSLLTKMNLDFSAKEPKKITK